MEFLTHINLKDSTLLDEFNLVYEIEEIKVFSTDCEVKVKGLPGDVPYWSCSCLSETP